MSLVHRRTIMTADRIDRALRRIANEILEKCDDLKNVALIGIRSGGVNPCLRLAEYMKSVENIEVPVGMLDITLYRDDLSPDNKPLLKKTDIDFDVTGKEIIIIDDVLFTGRSMRAAIEVVMNYGRPARIKAAVVIDRGHRELPIQPDFVGQWIDTAPGEKVSVTIAEKNTRTDKVVLISQVEPEEDAQ